MLQSTDFAGNPTSYNYSDNLYTDNGSNPPQSYTPSQPTNAYLHTVTVPIIGLDETYGYFVASGDSAFSIDQNGGDSYAHFDSLGRVSTKYLPPSIGGTRGWTMFQYPTANELDSFISISSGTPSTSCTSCVHGQTLFDSQGRDASEVLVSDPDGATTTATSYDSLGRVHNSTNPYRSTSDPTYGTETFSYDSLNRTTSVVLADGSIANAFYGAGVGAAGGNTTQLCSSGTYGLGYPAMKVDPSGRKVQRWSDALGRVIEVDEQDATGSLTVGTCNVYDALGNLTQIVQGTQTRSFAYDGLSRLTTSATPEAGTKTDYFTTAAGGLCAGNPALICRTTDARGITSTSTYDGLNRVTSVSYSDGTPTVNYFYDQSSYNGLTITNGKGRLTGMSDGAGQSAYSYDLLGRVVAEIHTVAGNSKTTTYTYNLDGSMSSITYPSGRHLTYTYSNAQRPLSVVDSTSGVSYASAAVYAPQGAISTVKFGVAGSFLGITESNSYNHRLQVASQQASSSTGSALSLSYGYPAAPGNSGHVSSIANLLDAGRTENVVNDQLNRISTATSQATSGPDCWGQSFGYDRWANLLSVSVTQCSGSALGVSVTNNRITTAGYVYDASGDMTSDGSNSYTYDAEQRLTSAAGVTYTYDGRGLRVKKSNGTIYWRGYFSDASSESDLSGNISNEYVFFGGVRIARIDSLANVYYYFADRLGSTRAITTSNGTVCYSADFTPFGGETASVNSCPQNYRFANLERDLETGLDYAVYRHYSPRLGRFMQPDVLGGSISNPQSLNRYAYALDDPCDLTDPLGLSPCTLNIALKNTVGMSDAVIQDVEKQINALLGPSVTANFVNSTGDADASLVIESGFPNNPSMLGGNWGGAFDNFVYENNIIRSFPNAPIGTLINITGTVGAAELYHGVTGLKDVPTSAKFPNDIMSMDNMPRQTAKQKLSANTLQFTPDEKKALLNACLKDRNQSTDNPQLPDDTDEFEALQIPSDPDGTVTTKETDNLPAPCTNGQYSGCTVIGSPSGFSSGDGDGSDVGDGGGGGEPVMGFDDPAPDDEDFDE
jgi:RHS repeat-associated protein